MTQTLDDLIRTHSGKRSITWIAAQAGVSARTARDRAASMGLSVIVPQYAPADKATYAVRPPTAERERFALMINDLMDELGLRTQNAAVVAAVEHAYELLDSGDLQKESTP